MTTWGCGSVFKHLTTGGGLPPLTIANGFPSVPTSLYCTICSFSEMCTMCTIQKSPHEALLLLVVVSSIVETTCAVHLESIHTWAARLNLVIVGTASFPSVPTSLYYTMCTVRCVQCLQSKRVPTSLCCCQLSSRWLSRQLVHVHTSVARLNLVIARRSVPTSLHCYWFRLWGQLLCTWSLFTPELPVWTWWMTRN